MLVEITAPYWGRERKPLSVKLAVGRRKTGKQVRSRVQNKSAYKPWTLGRQYILLISPEL